MARKIRSRDAAAALFDAVVEGFVSSNDAPLVDVADVQAAPENGEAGDAPEPVGTAEADDALAEAVEDMPPLEAPAPAEAVPAMDAGAVPLAGGLPTLEADLPVTDDAPVSSGKKSRYDTPAKKAERNRKEKEKREAKTSERAGKVARATGIATASATRAAKVRDEPVQAAIMATTGVDLAVLLGLSFHAISMALPERYGGGTLTAAERDLLGKAWAGPLAPYLSGAAGPWAVAAISTVQVFAVRAMTYQPPAVPEVRHSRPEITAPATESPEDVPAAPAAPAGKMTQQEHDVGGE